MQKINPEYIKNDDIDIFINNIFKFFNKKISNNDIINLIENINNLYIENILNIFNNDYGKTTNNLIKNLKLK